MATYRESSKIVLSRLAEGESLREICADPKMPSLSTVYGWLTPGGRSHKPEFLSGYRVARMWQAEAIWERLLEVSRDPNLSEARRKAEMDALKVAVAKLEARKYGVADEGEVVVRVVYGEE